MDASIRTKAFSWLEDQTQIHGDTLPWTLLSKGFEFKGRRITLVGQKGIWKPKAMELPISILTSRNGPYHDHFTYEGFLSYKYRGNDPQHSDNVGLRELFRRQIPLVYFHSVEGGRYLPLWPVMIHEDDPEGLTFTVALEDKKLLLNPESLMREGSDIRRGYLTSQVKSRLHQSRFREVVLRAYQNSCTICRFKHRELLDAAHIIPDAQEWGDPEVKNGLSLCKIHHAAYDKHILGIDPDYSIEIREDILKEKDGPMLKHGLQKLHGQKILIPRRRINRPDPERLEMRYQDFLKAS